MLTRKGGGTRRTKVTITAAPVLLAPLSAGLLNNVSDESGSAGFDFVSGDLLGRIDLNVKTH